MENAQQIVYSLKEKYFSTDKESRIGGRQFLTRLRAPSLILIIAFILTFGLIAQIISPSWTNFIVTWFYLILMGMSSLWGNISSFTLLLVIIIPTLISSLSLLFIPTLIKKRCHDFWSSGNIENWLFIGVYILTLVVFILKMTKVVSDMNILLPIGTTILYYGWIILILYLIFRPWTKWANIYWEDTTNVKIWFLG